MYSRSERSGRAGGTSCTVTQNTNAAFCSVNPSNPSNALFIHQKQNNSNIYRITPGRYRRSTRQRLMSHACTPWPISTSRQTNPVNSQQSQFTPKRLLVQIHTPNTRRAAAHFLNYPCNGCCFEADERRRALTSVLRASYPVHSS